MGDAPLYDQRVKRHKTSKGVLHHNLALAAAGVAAFIPGFIEVDVKNWVRAGGAIAVFVVVYFFSPANLVTQPKAKSYAASPKGPVPSSIVNPQASDQARVEALLRKNETDAKAQQQVKSLQQTLNDQQKELDGQKNLIEQQNNLIGSSTFKRGHEHHRFLRGCNARNGRPRRFGGLQGGSGT
jgi:hypothetical protein